MKFKCRIGLHRWRIGFGWTGNRWGGEAKRFDCCFDCDKTRWVEDQKGYDKQKSESEYWSSTAGKRERRLSKILDK